MAKKQKPKKNIHFIRTGLVDEACSKFRSTLAEIAKTIDHKEKLEGAQRAQALEAIAELAEKHKIKESTLEMILKV